MSALVERVRRFSAEYLEEARRGLWEDRAALAALDLPSRGRILDVGCGTGALTRVLREESNGAVVGLDADRSLLAEVEADGRAVGDATRLPVADDAFDLVVCQALLINLPAPIEAVREFARVASDAVAAIEPDNDAVTVDSTVDAEPALARRAREAFMADQGTDLSLGADAVGIFEDAGLSAVTTRRHDHVRTTDPPYSERSLEAARRKLTAERLAANRETLLESVDREAYERLEREWRAMGREVAEQMGEGEYRREEVLPFYVTVGQV